MIKKKFKIETIPSIQREWIIIPTISFEKISKDFFVITLYWLKYVYVIGFGKVIDL
jgi:hypothetical protein